MSLAEPKMNPRLLENLMYFARALRAAGLVVGPGKVLDALQAVEAVGITNRADFYWTLHAVFVNQFRDREIFDQVFHVFWRNPRLLERMMSMVIPQFRDPGLVSEQATMRRRASEALAGRDKPRENAADSAQVPDIEVDGRLTWSQQELLQKKDFEQMSATELARAKQLISRLRLSVDQVPTRRYTPCLSSSHVDMRRTLRNSLRSGFGHVPLAYRKPATRIPPLVVLCDISGSMSQYSRMLLHFMHTLTGDRERVHSFVFGTRLTNISRYLENQDVDAALDKISDSVQDWSGGTRMGLCLHEFNRSWSRRVLAQGAVVLLISDGLDRDVAAGLSEEAERLHKSCRRFIWLNPLLRYNKFQPQAAGMRALLPHVDDFRSIHNLESLEDLCGLLSSGAQQHRRRASQTYKMHKTTEEGLYARAAN